MQIEVEEYVREDGSCPFRRWVDRLDHRAALKVSTALMRLEMGNTSNIKWFGGIGEYIIDFGPGYRVYLMQDGPTLILLFGGGTKRTQQRDIDAVHALRMEYKARKKIRRHTRKSGWH